MVPGLQTGPWTSITRAVCTPGHQEPRNAAGLRGMVSGTPLVAAGTGTVRDPMQPPAPFPLVTLSENPRRVEPVLPDEAGGTKRSAKRVVGPPCLGATVSPDAPGLVLLLVVAPVVLAEVLAPAPAELDVAEPQPAIPIAPPATATASQWRIEIVSAWRLIAGPSLRSLTRGFSKVR
jgi:hypothetical protein